MAPLSNHVSMSITRAYSGPTRQGFGTLLLLSPNAAFAERVRSYSSEAAVAVDFAVATSPERVAAAIYFGQSPKPATLKVGRQALKHTQVVVIAIATVRNSYVYKVTVKGKGVTTTTATFTSDATAINDEIVAGLVIALNAVVGKNYTAAANGGAGNQVVLTTATAAGDWFSFEVSSVTDLTVSQTHVDAGVATDLAAIALEDNDWFGLYTFQNSNAVALATAGWCESNEKFYVMDSSDSTCVTAILTGSDTIDDLHTLSYAWTLPNYHPDPSSMFGVGWAAQVLPIEPGGDTWKWKTVVGVVPVVLSDTQRTNLTNKSGNSYETVSGINVTYEGTTADGDFADVTRGLAWFKDDCASEIYGSLAGASKIPRTEAGIAVLKNDAWGSVDRGIARTLIVGTDDEDPARRPTVTSTRISDMSSADAAARRIYLEINFTMAGAIHKVNVTANVTV